ncbi:TPA: hypothetical protein QCI16_005049 [Enterobacter ludwigii]|nr:hypothetical protein [Enterobacter ludwigii]HDR2600797.1 hypothetical protein [Enterobacter ludwigii]
MKTQLSAPRKAASGRTSFQKQNTPHQTQHGQAIKTISLLLHTDNTKTPHRRANDPQSTSTIKSKTHPAPWQLIPGSPLICNGENRGS